MHLNTYKDGLNLCIEIEVSDHAVFVENLCQEAQVVGGKLVLIRSPCGVDVHKKHHQGNLYEPKYSLTAIVEGVQEPLSVYNLDGKIIGALGLELEEAMSEMLWRDYRKNLKEEDSGYVLSLIKYVINANYHYSDEFDDDGMWNHLDDDFDYWSKVCDPEMLDKYLKLKAGLISEDDLD